MSACFVNRELSWLEFNRRVLENAADPATPLCERLNFISIFQSNLDEFFMVRIGSLHDQKLLDDGTRDNKTGMTPSRQIESALDRIRLLCRFRDQVYNQLMKEMHQEGISIVRFSDVSVKAEKALRNLFSTDVLPYLSYYNINRKKDFPFLNNKDIYAIAIMETRKQERKVVVVPCSGTVQPRLISVPDRKGQFILLEEFILHYLPVLFPKNIIVGKTLVRITRSADIDADSVYDEDLNYREHMEEIIKERKRLSPVRMELSRQIDPGIVQLLCRQLKLNQSQVFEYDTPLDLSFFYPFMDLLRNRPSLFYAPRHSRRLILPEGTPYLISLIREKDLLLHYPYDSFNTFLKLLHEAAVSPRVKAIRMTLYRVARDSKVAEALAEAAENGKQVEVFVELKARFDEENNIEWSRRLETAGCRVIYGIEHIKVHSKLCIITCVDEQGQEFLLTQIGTGNYNEKTSKIYTDFSYFTCDPWIGRSGLAVFQALTEEETVETSERLLVSPNCMENRLITLVDQEIQKGEKGRIRLKLNSLTDRPLMDKLIQASCAGVSIDMVIRGICCLLPGVPGKTENIRIRSIVGRYLEHSRMYLFGEGEDIKVFISSADWMTRNMRRRVEIACPITGAENIHQLERIFDAYLRDTAQSWTMTNEGTYVRNKENADPPLFDVQDSFYI